MTTRQSKITQARKLRAQTPPVSYREIGERLGVATVTAYNWVNPERVAPYRNGRAIDPEKARADDRKYSRTHRGTCSQCGGDRPRGCSDGVCSACHAGRISVRAWKIEQWWAEGLTMREIADRLGWTMGHLSVEMVRLREKGRQLPYRRAVYPAADGKPRFPEQVAT